MLGETVCDSGFIITDNVGVALDVIAIVGELVMLGIIDELEPKVFEPDKMIDTLVVSDALPVIERGVTSVVDVNVASGVIDGVKVGESVDEGTALEVKLALPPKEIVDGGVSDGVDSALGVSLALAPIEIVGGGVEEGDDDSEEVGDDVEEGESLEDCVCVGVNVFELVPDPDKVGDAELLDVIDALAPRVTLVDGVAVFEEVTDALAEADALTAALILKITLGLDTTLIVAVVINDDEIITLTLE